MFEPIEGMPEGTLGWRLTGPVRAEDYREVFVPALREKVDAGEEIRSLYLAADDFSETPSGMWADMKAGAELGVGHWKSWRRTAFVTDVEWLRKTFSAFAWMMPGRGEALLRGRARGREGLGRRLSDPDQTSSLPSGAVISTNQFKNGTHIEVDGTIYRIMEFQHVKPGKGGAFVRTKLKRAEDGNVVDKTFRAGEKFRPVRTETRRMQYLYDSGDAAVFMDTETYDQTEIQREGIADEMQWVVPNDEVELLLVDERPSGIQIASAIDMTVSQTDPGLKGDTASGGGTKPATLESGVVVQVPLFVNEGERIRVDTRSGEYVSRANAYSSRHTPATPWHTQRTTSAPQPRHRALHARRKAYSSRGPRAIRLSRRSGCRGARRPAVRGGLDRGPARIVACRGARSRGDASEGTFTSCIRAFGPSATRAPPWEGRMLAAVIACGPTALLSHYAANELFGFVDRLDGSRM